MIGPLLALLRRSAEEPVLCPTCGKPVSPTTVVCPHCKEPLVW